MHGDQRTGVLRDPRVVADMVPVAVRGDDQLERPPASLELAPYPLEGRDRRVDRDRLARSRVAQDVDVRRQDAGDPGDRFDDVRGSGRGHGVRTIGSRARPAQASMAPILGAQDLFQRGPGRKRRSTGRRAPGTGVGTCSLWDREPGCNAVRGRAQPRSQPRGWQAQVLCLRATNGHTGVDLQLTVLEASPSAIVAVNERGSINYVNPQAETTFGY